MTHPGTDVLAEFRAGLITGHRGDRIAAHLAGCEHCRVTDARLTELPALLAAGPPPVMPPDVAQRLDQVLAAEVAHRDQAERVPHSDPPQAATPRRRRRDRPRRDFRVPSLRVIGQAAAAAVILAAGGYVLFGTSSGDTASSPAVVAGGADRSAATSAAPQAQAQAPQESAAAGAVPSANREGQPVSFVYVASRTDFTPATLTTQLKQELGRTPAAAGTVQAMPDAVRGCVARVAPGASVVRVESARYQGQAATVIFTRNGQVTRAVITSPDCSGTNGHVVAAANLPAGISGP